jgi:Family of unknown function (DUF5317)
MLTLLILPVLVGLAAGWLAGGRPMRLLDTPLRALWLVWIAVLIQLALSYVPAARQLVEHDLGVPMLLPIYLGIGLWLAINLPGRAWSVRLGIALLLTGGAMNGLAILANGRMPFSVPAARHAGLSDAKIFAADLPKAVSATQATRLAWLGDIIPVRPIHAVMSAGDVVIIVGIVLVVAAGMRLPRSAGDSHPPVVSQSTPERDSGH